MSQNQPRRPGQSQERPTRCGDVLPEAGGHAGENIAPRAADMMQSAENRVLGRTPNDGPASVMESAATRNKQRGVVSNAPGLQSVSVTQTDRPGQRLVTKFVAGQAVGQYVIYRGAGNGDQGGGGCSVAMWTDKVTIGEALEATATTAGDKTVEASDAAAIQAAEATAMGVNAVTPGGVAAAAQAAAAANTSRDRDDDKTRLGQVVKVTDCPQDLNRMHPTVFDVDTYVRRYTRRQDAAMRLPVDKVATRQDAERVLAAEMRNSPDLLTYPGGVGASMVAAARLNQQR
ncbi:late embryogenesis abundant protein [Musa troglodytarum]|uniref:Late embryogenesis abundant protein n=1 Tax=Musa troglodytarum TaxID=320322 RepID=A0A9E7E9V2_9LILI|nr:late embryogenesis abundant protein [Musa troglodytarum]